ncbi:MAG: NADH:flavin oxidoreductase/NADH oxidase family protein [Sandaracinaceae bacterium]
MPTLNDPFTLPTGRTLAHRLVKAAMTEGLADDHNRATARHVTLYRRWAEGGAALLVTGNVQVDRRYLERAGNVAIDGPQDGEARAALRAWAEAGQDAGSQVWVQLSHAGRQTPKPVARVPVAPSAVRLGLPGGQFGTPRALTDAEVEDVIERFVHAATVCQQTGFDGVQIHSAHGYLLSEFLSPRVNRRDDRWGGSLANRARLLLTIVRRIRDAVGSTFAVSVKLNSADFQKGGFAFDDCLQVVTWLNERGLDLLEISGGTYEQPKMLSIDGIEPLFEEDAALRASTRRREAYFLKYAEAVREVATMPLMVTGGFRSRAGIDEALTSGALDLVGLGRPLCLDPAACRKVLDGSVDALEDVEARMRLGPGWLGPASPFDLVKALNGFAKMGWYYEQLYRLADGQDVEASLSLLRALVAYQTTERRRARALNRAPASP